MEFPRRLCEWISRARLIVRLCIFGRVDCLLRQSELLAFFEFGENFVERLVCDMGVDGLVGLIESDTQLSVATESE